MEEEAKQPQAERKGQDSNNPLLAREEFAISLRKNKKKQIVELKRRKSLEFLAMSLG